MATVTAAMVKELREKSGAGMMDCKKALVECDGDIKKSMEWLQIKGIASASKRSGRSTNEGWIGSYIHSDGKTGVIVECCCETDFVAKTDDFKTFAHKIAMHICACSPLVVKSEDVDPELLANQRKLFEEQAAESGKPEAICKKMAEGRLAKWLKEISLLDQPYFEDGDKTVDQVRVEISAKTGENVVIRRFARLSLKDTIEEKAAHAAE